MNLNLSSLLRLAAIGAAAFVFTSGSPGAGQAPASQKVRFAAAFQTEFTATLDADYVAHINVVGDGAASLLGDATCETSDQVQNPDGTGTATYVLRSTRGTVTLTCIGHGKPSDPATPGAIEVGGTYKVTGGTGFFHGATGGGTFTVSVMFTGPAGGVGQFALWGDLEFAQPHG